MKKQFYATIYEQEDIVNGLYSDGISEENVLKSKKLLSNLFEFDNAMEKVFREWKVSTCVNLSNNSINRRAWLGQSSCLIIHECNERETKKAWFMLSEDEQNHANKLAESKITKFEKTWNGKLESISKLGSEDATLMESQTRLILD